METTFKVKKSGKYIDIQYITGIKLPMSVYDNCLVSTVKEARHLIDFIRKMENGIKENLAEKGLDLDYRLIVIKHLQAIDAIASGIEIRSKLSVKELSERFVSGFKIKMDEILAECETTFKIFNEIKDNTHYYENGRLYDKFNEYVRDYNLPFERIKLEDFGKNILDDLIKKSDEMLQFLINERKKK
jgi:hypothetical protein